MFEHYDIHGLPVTCDKAESELHGLRDDLAHARAHIDVQAAQIRRLTSGRPTTINALTPKEP